MLVGGVVVVAAVLVDVSVVVGARVVVVVGAAVVAAATVVVGSPSISVDGAMLSARARSVVFGAAVSELPPQADAANRTVTNIPTRLMKPSLFS